MSKVWEAKYPDKKRESAAKTARKRRGGLIVGTSSCPKCGRKIGMYRNSNEMYRHKNIFGRWCGK